MVALEYARKGTKAAVHPKRWVAVVIVLVMTFGYLSFPCIAGSMGILGRSGPPFYLATHWETCYIIGWEEAGRPGKPRSGPARQRATQIAAQP